MTAQDRHGHEVVRAPAGIVLIGGARTAREARHPVPFTPAEPSVEIVPARAFEAGCAPAWQGTR